LTGSKNPTDYLKKLRKRDVDIRANCPHVEMLVNGKKQKALAGDVKGMLCINLIS
jgi:hypothetical protein